MQVLDEDVQMVRDALKNAPEYVKSHFENLVEQHAKEADRAETLAEKVEVLEQDESAEVEKMQDERNALQSRLDEIEGDGMREALETVKYWLHDFFYAQRTTKSAREILTAVERAI